MVVHSLGTGEAAGFDSHRRLEMDDQTCKHGYHECQTCDEEETPPQMYGSGGITVLGKPKLGQVLVAVSSTELEWQDPPWVVRSTN